MPAEGVTLHTSLFGGTPDWIYFSPSTVRPVESLQGVDFISKPMVSDHNALKATYEVRL